MPTYYYNEEEYIKPGQGVFFLQTKEGDAYVKLGDVRSFNIETSCDGLFGSAPIKHVSLDVEKIEVILSKNVKEINESEVINLLEEM